LVTELSEVFCCSWEVVELGRSISRDAVDSFVPDRTCKMVIGDMD